MIKPPPQVTFVDEVKIFLKNENWQIFNELSFTITSNEITKVINKLKTGKVVVKIWY